jgi:hypothetical protein
MSRKKYLEFFQNLVLKFQNVRGKVHGNQGMKQLGLEIIRKVSRREKVKRLEFMNESLWEELRRITMVKLARSEKEYLLLLASIKLS